MKSRPQITGEERLICYSSIDQRHRFTGDCKQKVAGINTGEMAGLMICFHEEEQAFYLYGCDDEWNVVTDTWHKILVDAKQQAEFEYEGISKTWINAK